MKFCAIICEFNPLHNGHIHIIKQAKAKTGLPVLCLLSGNFCQRAVPAIAEKHTRANWAIQAGADVVFELPTIFATGSARDFASGAVNILKSLPVEYLMFGSECGDIDTLVAAKDFAKSLDNSQLVKDILRRGENYKTAVIEAAKQQNPQIAEILAKPNNMLAIEYLRALEGTNITPLTILREDNFLQNSTQNFCSSSAIRNAQETSNFDSVKHFAPPHVLKQIEHKKNCQNIFEHLLFALKTTTAERLEQCPSCTFDLKFRILKCANTSNTFQEFLEQCATKRYSQIRIRRVALENFFGITKETLKFAHMTTPTTILLAKTADLHFDGFFAKKINLVLKKSDFVKYQNEPTLKIDILAQKLYER